VSLALLLWVTVCSSIDTTSANGSGQDTLALLASPSAWLITNSEGLRSTGQQSCFGSLLKFGNAFW
jgi:hypothetical protein